MLNIFLLRIALASWALAKEVEKLLNVTKNVIATGQHTTMYVIQIYTMACASICNSVSVVIELS